MALKVGAPGVSPNKLFRFFDLRFKCLQNRLSKGVTGKIVFLKGLQIKYSIQRGAHSKQPSPGIHRGLSVFIYCIQYSAWSRTTTPGGSCCLAMG
jgi:hypothetical protein